MLLFENKGYYYIVQTLKSTLSIRDDFSLQNLIFYDWAPTNCPVFRHPLNYSVYRMLTFGLIYMLIRRQLSVGGLEIKPTF